MIYSYFLLLVFSIFLTHHCFILHSRVYGRLQEALTENEWSNRATTVAIADTRSKDFNTIARMF